MFDFDIRKNALMKLETTLRNSSALPIAPRPLGLESLWLTNQIRVVTSQGISRELSSPMVGRDFLSGLLEDSKTIGFFRKSTLRLIEPRIPEGESGSVVFTRKTLAEQLQLLQFPTVANFVYRDGELSTSAYLLGAARGFLICDQIGQPVIPIAALGQIEIRNA